MLYIKCATFMTEINVSVVSKEQQRRADVNRYNVYVRITFNNKEVSRTPARSAFMSYRSHASVM